MFFSRWGCFYSCRLKISWTINRREEVNKREVFQCLKLILLFSVNIVNRRCDNCFFYEMQSSLSLSSVTNSARLLLFQDLFPVTGKFGWDHPAERAAENSPVRADDSRVHAVVCRAHCVTACVSEKANQSLQLHYYTMTQHLSHPHTHTYITTRSGNYSATGEIRIQMYLS